MSGALESQLECKCRILHNKCAAVFAGIYRDMPNKGAPPNKGAAYG